MIGIILISHGKLAEGILDAGKMIYPDIENVETVMLSNVEGIEKFTFELKKAIDDLKTCKDVLLMCDLQGGSPYNVGLELAIKRYSNKNMRVISGLNLPMFLEIIAMRDTANLEELVNIAIQTGKESIFAPEI